MKKKADLKRLTGMNALMQKVFDFFCCKIFFSVVFFFSPEEKFLTHFLSLPHRAEKSRQPG
jgi:hypothetical protein